MIVRTNVKLNLGLGVLRKRLDGYHDIETLFLPCDDFGDTLEIVTGDDYSRTSASLFARYGEPSEPDPDDSAEDGCLASEDRRIVQGISPDGGLMITIAREEGVDWNPLKDLCAKAWAILAADYKLPPVKIFLEKTAPVGAGLGGGSADAAFTLKVLNELCSLNIPESRLFEYAAWLGSDCAFFVAGRPMIGRGRGEVLTPFDIDLSGYVIQVLVPKNVTVSTAEAYKGIVPREAAAGQTVQQPAAGDFDDAAAAAVAKGSAAAGTGSAGDGGVEIPGTAAGVAAPALEEILARPVEEWNGLLVNDFETTVFKNHPELAAIKQSLYDSGAVYAAMSGSGSAIFGIYRK